jgi:putative flippase GtrA
MGRPARLSFDRVLTVILLTLACIWVAVVNGQPLFMEDTTAYVRGPDYAVVRLLGGQFRTAWTQRQSSDSPHELQDTPKPDPSLNSNVDPLSKAILSGRSIYYGAFLYLGHLTSSFWLSVLAQAAIFMYLTHTFVIKCVRLPFSAYLLTVGILLVATPLSFFISFLMPDIFASYLIIALIILGAFWDELQSHDRSITAIILLFSVLAHTSHLALAACLAVAFCFFALIWHRGNLLANPFPQQFIVLVVVIGCGIVGEIAFAQATHFATGVAPVRPPFVMARVIADGPGTKFLQQNCASKTYRVCKYADRFPMHALQFLWSTDPSTGVFSAANVETRNALSSEQSRFVLDVIKFDPYGELSQSTRNTALQFWDISLDDFVSSHKHLISSLAEKVPATYYDGLLRARIFSYESILTVINEWFFIIYTLSIAGLVIAWVFWRVLPWKMLLSSRAQQQWFFAITLTLSALIFNAMICGALSQVTSRYQSRVSWIPLFVLTIFIMAVWSARLALKTPDVNARDPIHRLAALLPRPLRFIGAGAIGLTTDIVVFTGAMAFWPYPLLARILSLAVATLVTWRLNRALTFDRSGRYQADEAMRYIAVTAVSQGTSYAIFAVLVLTVLAPFPQLAVLPGAVIGAFVAYNGHRLVAFKPTKATTQTSDMVTEAPFRQ